MKKILFTFLLFGCKKVEEIPDECEKVEDCTDGSMLLSCVDARGMFYQTFWTPDNTDTDYIISCKGADLCEYMKASNLDLCFQL